MAGASWVSYYSNNSYSWLEGISSLTSTEKMTTNKTSVKKLAHRQTIDTGENCSIYRIRLYCKDFNPITHLFNRRYVFNRRYFGTWYMIPMGLAFCRDLSLSFLQPQSWNWVHRPIKYLITLIRYSKWCCRGIRVFWWNGDQNKSLLDMCEFFRDYHAFTHYWCDEEHGCSSAHLLLI